MNLIKMEVTSDAKSSDYHSLCVSREYNTIFEENVAFIRIHFIHAFIKF